MNGIHDMGGLHGFGKVEVEPNEKVFHSRWESRVYAMTQVLDTTVIYSLDDRKIEWGAWRKDVTVTPKFRQGDSVRVRNLHPPGNTRLTAYVRGRVGVVQIVNDQAWVFPDARAHRRGEKLQPVYNVRFTSRELWGEQAEPNVFVNADLSEDYLEPALRNDP